MNEMEKKQKLISIPAMGGAIKQNLIVWKAKAINPRDGGGNVNGGFL